MTDKAEGLRLHNSELNKIVCESLQTTLLILLKEKDYSNISVTELCGKAGVSRTAFYNNFQTKERLLESVFIERTDNLIVDKIGSPFREYIGYSRYLKLFTAVKTDSDFLVTLFNAGFKEKYLSVINAMVLHDVNISSTKKYLRIIWAGGLVNTLMFWIENGMSEPVEDIAKFCFENMSVC